MKKFKIFRKDITILFISLFLLFSANERIFAYVSPDNESGGIIPATNPNNHFESYNFPQQCQNSNFGNSDDALPVYLPLILKHSYEEDYYFPSGGIFTATETKKFPSRMLGDLFPLNINNLPNIICSRNLLELSNLYTVLVEEQGNGFMENLAIKTAEYLMTKVYYEKIVDGTNEIFGYSLTVDDLRNLNQLSRSQLEALQIMTNIQFTLKANETKKLFNRFKQVGIDAGIGIGAGAAVGAVPGAIIGALGGILVGIATEPIMQTFDEEVAIVTTLEYIKDKWEKVTIEDLRDSNVPDAIMNHTVAGKILKYYCERIPGEQSKGVKIGAVSGLIGEILGFGIGTVGSSVLSKVVGEGVGEVTEAVVESGTRETTEEVVEAVAESSLKTGGGEVSEEIVESAVDVAGRKTVTLLDIQDFNGGWQEVGRLSKTEFNEYLIEKWNVMRPHYTREQLEPLWFKDWDTYNWANSTYAPRAVAEAAENVVNPRSTAREARGWSIQNSTKRAVQQDAFFSNGSLSNGYKFHLVADGYESAGERASAIARDRFGGYVDYYLQQGDNISTAVRRAVEGINSDIYSDTTIRGGTTLVAAVENPMTGDVIVANVGDSRAYLVGKDFSPVQLTVDHTEVQYLVSKGALTPAEAATYPRKNIIARGLGADQYVDVDIFTLNKEENRKILLCSDGLHGVLTNIDIWNVINSKSGFLDFIFGAFRGATSYEQIVQNLVDLAIRKGSTDNTTAVLF